MQFYRKKARSMGVPIVPMIDILTILLIFFIVHTQWKKPQSLLKIDVPGAEFMEGTPSSEQRAVLAVTGTSAISLNGRLVEMNELAAALEALKRKIQASNCSLMWIKSGVWHHCRHLGCADVCGY